MIKIASFNVHNLSDGKGRDLDRIAELIRQYDIVAMQEVLAEGKILTGMKLGEARGQAMAYERSLLSRLGEDKWEIRWGDPKVRAKNYPYLGNDSRGEGYAFLWRKDKFEMPKGKEGQRRVYPKIWNQYKPLEGQIGLIRDPFYGRFIVKGRPLEIRLICTHIVYGKPDAKNMSVEVDSGAIQMRKNEFNILAGQIYQKVSQYHKDINCTVPYTLILGDYNLNLISSGIPKALAPEVALFDQRGRRVINPDDADIKIYTEQNQLTTINADATGYASNYDHFSYDEKTKSKVVYVGVAPEAKAMLEKAEDFSDYKELVSDHVPVVIELNL